MNKVTRMAAPTAIAVGILLLPTLARADIMSFTYSDLSGSFNSGASTFVATDRPDTDGDVTRLEGPAITANLDFSSGAIGSASFDLVLSVGAITATTATSTGTLVITDVDGDQWTADVSGNWVNVAGSANLNGILTNVQPLSTGDGMFEGTTGAFSMAFASPMPYFGNIITLVFSGWFSDAGGTPADFSGRSVLASGQVTAIPSPSALVLGIIGIAVVGMRRRTGVSA